MAIGLEEQETVINIRRDSEFAEIWTSDTTTMTRLDKLAKNKSDWECYRVEKFKDGTVAGKWYRCPKKLVSYRGSTSTGSRRFMTDEQKAATAERLKKAREEKAKQKNKLN